MSYQPKEQIIDLRQAAAQIFEFIQAKQVEAIAWAGATGLKPIAKFYTSAAGRLNTILPALTLLERETAPVEITDDQLTMIARFVFEFVSDGPKTDELVAAADDYGFILESLLGNLPHGIFDRPGGQHQPFIMLSVESYYGVFRGAIENASAYYNVIQLRAAYQLTASAYLNKQLD